MNAIATAFAQGGAGIALVTGLALLCVRQTSVAFILITVQSSAVAVGAVAMHRPLLALPPLVLAAWLWFTREWTDHDATEPAGGPKLGVCAGAALAILSQSQGNLGLPLAATLLSVLLAATRTAPFMRTIALVALQNSVIMAVCIGLPNDADLPLLLPLACVVLPLPLSAGLLIPVVAAHAFRNRVWLGWTDLALSVAVLGATCLIPLDPIGSVLAPVLGLDGVLRAEARRKRHAGPQGLAPTRFTMAGRGLALLNSICVIAAVCAPAPLIAWFAILAAIAAALLPTLRRRGDQALLANAGAGIVLAGIVLQAATPSTVAYLCLFAGFAMIVAVVPDLAAVAVAVLLRLAIQQDFPSAAGTLGVVLALLALFGCAALLIRGRRPAAANIGEWATPALAGEAPGTSLWTSGPLTIFTDPPSHLSAIPNGNLRISSLIPNQMALGSMARVPRSAAEPDSMVTLTSDRATLLLLSQASIATLAICIGSPEGRFAALILLMLLILSRSAARLTRGPIATLAFAGLAGIPPLGVFPGLVLVVLAVAGHDPWLLPPLGLLAIPMMLAGLPNRMPDLRSASAFRSLFWIPLVLALVAGYGVPTGLAQWLHITTAGHP